MVVGPVEWRVEENGSEVPRKSGLIVKPRFVYEANMFAYMTHGTYGFQLGMIVDYDYLRSTIILSIYRSTVAGWKRP